MYCIDTGPIIVMKNYYPIDMDIFQPLWQELETAGKNKLIISPREVLKELECIDDELLKWAKEHFSFQKLDANQLEIMQDIMTKFPNCVDTEKTIPEADPFVIALAKSKNCTVITHERSITLSGPQSRPRIPNICEALEVGCIPLLEFFKERGVIKVV